MLKTVFDADFSITPDDLEYDYQESLTKKLDSNSTDFNQNTLNEIVLWKLNRYAAFDSELISLINSVERNAMEIDIDKTNCILKGLLKTKGVRLAMASTILRYRNPKIYQIIDQRVYRIIYNKELKPISIFSEENLNSHIKLYLQYLIDLKKECSNLDIPFEESDRILYRADKRINKKHKIK